MHRFILVNQFEDNLLGKNILNKKYSEITEFFNEFIFHLCKSIFNLKIKLKVQTKLKNMIFSYGYI